MRKKTLKMLAMATVATACFATATACLKIQEANAESAFAMMNGAAVFMKDSLIPIIGEENMRREFPWEEWGEK